MGHGDALCGNATTNGGTILTIPAGTSWKGTVTLSATVQIGSGGAAVMASARVSIAGAGAMPPAGDYLRVDLQAPASILGAIGTGDSGSMMSDMFITAGASPVTLVLNTTGTSSQSASANGRIL